MGYNQTTQMEWTKDEIKYFAETKVWAKLIRLKSEYRDFEWSYTEIDDVDRRELFKAITRKDVLVWDYIYELIEKDRA